MGHAHQALRGSAAPGEGCELGRDGPPGAQAVASWLDDIQELQVEELQLERPVVSSRKICLGTPEMTGETWAQDLDPHCEQKRAAAMKPEFLLSVELHWCPLGSAASGNTDNSRKARK